MAEYEYAGPGPQVDPEGELVRPFDVREFAEEPPWGPWRLLAAPEEPAPAPPPVIAPAPVSGPPATPATPPKGM